MEDIKEDIKEIFTDLFSLENTLEIESINRNSFERWDSMAHVALISALEGQFDISIELQQALIVNCINDCVDLVSELIQE